MNTVSDSGCEAPDDPSRHDMLIPSEVEQKKPVVEKNIKTNQVHIEEDQIIKQTNDDPTERDQNP